MPVTVIKCPSCKAPLRVPDHMIGNQRVVKCPGCGQVIHLPELISATAVPPAQEEPYSELEVMEEGKPKEAGFEVVGEDEPQSGKKKRSREGDDDRVPRKKRLRKAGHGMSPLMWVGLGVGGFVLLVAVIVVVVLVVRVAMSPRLTDENYAKIEVGMSRQEVEKILGSGHIEQDAREFGRDEFTLGWQGKGIYIAVVFFENRVTEKIAAHGTVFEGRRLR